MFYYYTLWGSQTYFNRGQKLLSRTQNQHSNDFLIILYLKKNRHKNVVNHLKGQLKSLVFE